MVEFMVCMSWYPMKVNMRDITQGPNSFIYSMKECNVIETCFNYRDQVSFRVNRSSTE